MIGDNLTKGQKSINLHQEGQTHNDFIAMSFIFAHGVFERWRRDKEEGEHYKSQGNCRLRPYRFKPLCIISSKQSDPTRGTKEIYTSMKDMERFFQVGCFLVYRRHSKAIELPDLFHHFTMLFSTRRSWNLWTI